MAQANGNSTIKVERGIPVPKRSRRGKPRYPWDKMRVGDSFLVECPKNEAIKAQNTVSSCGAAWARKHGGQFTTRAVDGGVRVWRISADD